jgi:hypothetical protein
MSFSSEFLDSAKTAGASSKEHFEQGTLFKEISVKSKGICGGLSLVFLGLYAKDGFKSLTEAKTWNAMSLYKYSSKIQGILVESKVFPGTLEQNISQNILANFTKSAPVVGLISNSKIIKFRWPCIGEISNTITGNPGYYIIALPNHYVAASYNGKEGTFFDPNAGAGLFINAVSLSAMLTFYFTRPKVTQAYDCSGKDIYLIPFKKG